MKRLKNMLMLPLVVLMVFGLACERSATKVDDTYMREEPAAKPAAQKPKPLVTESIERIEPQLPKEVVFGNVNFDFDKYDLTFSAREILADHARKLGENPRINLLIEGHCDELGTIEYNLALGEKRANAVKQYLINMGIDPSRLTTISYGKERPLDSERNEQAWAKNRRAAFVKKN